MLLGRRAECELLDQLIRAVREGESQALVIRGEAGVGKTALLAYVAERAAGCRLVRVAGVQSEMELAFAALHQLCTPMLDRLDRLPGSQRDAIGTAFGLQAGHAPDRFLVGLAVLSLMAEQAEEQPLVCLLDDAQWLDRASAQALAFVARRLFAESVAVVFTVRASSGEAELEGLPQLEIGGLSEPDARKLVSSAIHEPFDQQVRDRIVAEARGNPLALLELPRGLTHAELAGGFGLPTGHGLASGIEDSFRRQLSRVSSDTRWLLLLAAAEPLGEPELVWRAARQLGIEADAAAAAAATGLCDFDATVRFRHPLVRSAVYRAASLEERRTAHGALADATDPGVDPDRHAWHKAHATTGPNEEVAAALERSASRAQARGGLAAAAAFLKRAAELTPEPEQRGRRTLHAAQATQQAGAFDEALRLVEMAEAEPLDELQRARAGLLRGQIAFASSHGNDAPPLLLEAAKRLEPLDIALGRHTYLEAFAAAMFAGRLAGPVGLREVAEAARAARQPAQPPRASDLLLGGLALLFTEGYLAAAPTLREALNTFRDEKSTRDEGLPWLWLACITAADLWDDETWYTLSTRDVTICREAGALSDLLIALSSRVYVLLLAGELAAAASLVEELEAITEVTGSELAPYGALGLSAWRGREAEAVELIEASMSNVVVRGQGNGVTLLQWARALVYNGLGRYGDALLAAEEASAYREEMAASSNWGLIELIEAAARSDNTKRATEALRTLSESTRVCGTDWALGVEARSRALLSEGEDAEDHYRESIERLRRTRVRVELARAHLLYGEWLRRERRRLEAREQLRTAHEMFTAMGVEAFAERAARELRATGETARKRTVATSGHLTPQEAQVARLASEGHTNTEIGSRLFLSPRTVEYHLRKVFTKLRITSRNELRDRLRGQSDTALSR